MSSSYVYFLQTADNLIRIGWSEHKKRLASHALNGHSLLAVVPGADQTHETNLKQYFKHLCRRGNEWFESAPVLQDYIVRLLECNYAGPTLEVAQWLPSLPWKVWSPQGVASNHGLDQEGQLSIFKHLPFNDRIGIASRDVVLSSQSDNWYTPKVWADRARLAMGSIDLDPASCHEANDRYIKAKTFYTKEFSGLDIQLPWSGNIWLNPPYGKGENSAGNFMARLCGEIESRNVAQAVTCLNLNSMGSRWFMETCAKYATAHLIVDGRINFVPPYKVDKPSESPSKGTVMSYFGSNIPSFEEHFGPHGKMLYPKG